MNTTSWGKTSARKTTVRAFFTLNGKMMSQKNQTSQTSQKSPMTPERHRKTNRTKIGKIHQQIPPRKGISLPLKQNRPMILTQAEMPAMPWYLPSLNPSQNKTMLLMQSNRVKLANIGLKLLSKQALRATMVRPHQRPHSPRPALPRSTSCA